MNMDQNDLESMFQQAKSLRQKDTVEIPKIDKTLCKSCNKRTLLDDFSNGIIVCTSCGVINDDHIIDESAEWSFGADEAASGGKDPARCGMPTNH